MGKTFQGGRVVIVGGGIVGASIAYHLARQGHSDVVILERGMVGEGATAYATGGIRHQFSTRVNIELVQASFPFWQHFEDEVGFPLHFRQHGYLFLLSDPAVHAVFQDSVALQRQMGVPVEVLTAADVAAAYPGIRTDDLLGATFTPNDGSASPTDAVNGMITAAKRMGVKVREHCTMTGIEQDDDGVVLAVTAGAERITAEQVIIAAGPQTTSVGRLCGLDVPVFPHSRQAFAAGPLPDMYRSLPLTVDMATGAYLHPESGGRSAVIGGHDRDTPTVDRAAVNWQVLPDLVGVLAGRFRHLDTMEVSQGWAGLREMTPDDHGIVSPVASTPGLWVVAGFSGHGFMQAPAVGRSVACALLGEPTPVDLHPLRLDRFTDDGDRTEEGAVF